MRTATLVPDPAVVTLEELVADDAGVTLVLRARRPTACCPLCDRPATRVHSWYIRQLADVSWQGLAVRLRLHTRRWFCCNAQCTRRIFAERLPTVAAPHGQRTQRLATIVLVFGVAVGGAPGARLLGDLGIAVSGDTLRRAVCAAALPDAGTPRVLGVDDWSLKRGHTYGTILVDLEERRPVDLLPDRSAASLATWLKEHPGVEIICRDRGGAYADGARQGAPAATQVADRWHLFANLGDMLERLLARHHAALGQVRLIAAAPPAPVTAAPDAVCTTLADPLPGPPTPVRAAREREQRDARREARYTEIHALHRTGLSLRAVARHLGINKRTVQKYLAAPRCPHPGPRPNRRRAITPYLPYLRERWDAGEHRVDVLWAAVRERGFAGAAPRVREALAPWRREERAARLAAAVAASPASPPPPPAGKRCAPRQVAAWLVREPGDLKPAQQIYLDALGALCPALATTRALARGFARLLRERDETGLEAWLVAAVACDVAEIREFAAGIRRDQAAVQAALEHAWSSGQVEGQVNRLKLVKRQAYGRAGFALLRRRYLLAS